MMDGPDVHRASQAGRPPTARAGVLPQHPRALHVLLANLKAMARASRARETLSALTRA